jgi:outer membrane autotransporter protein
MVGAGGIGIAAGDSNIITNNGTVIVGPNGISIGTCGCFASDFNTVVNNGTLDGTIALLGSGNTFTNAGLITITDPGTAVGAFHEIDGTFTQTAAGTLALRVNAAGVSDQLFVTSANLAGTLRAVVQPGLYGNTTVYNGVVIACLCNGLNGTKFDTVTSTSPFLKATASYDYAGVSAPIFDPNVTLTLTRIPFGALPGETQNQRAVGNFLEANYSTSLTGAAAAFFSTLLAGPSVPPFDQLSGEGTSGTQQTAFMAVDLFMATLTGQGTAWLGGGSTAPNGTGGPMQYAAAKPEHPAFKALKLSGEPPRPWNVWAAGFGGTQSLSGDPVVVGSADLSHRTAGGAAGVNYQANPDLLVGFAAGGSTSDFSVPDRMTSGHLDGAHLGAFGVSRWGALYALGTASYGWFDNSTTRTIVGVGPAEFATGRFTSNALGGRLELGYRQPVQRLTVTPFAAVQFLQLWQRGYTETSITAAGAPGVLGLSVQPHAVSSLPTFLGAQVETRLTFDSGAIWAPFGRVSWVHEFEPQRDIAAALSLLPVGAFTVEGPRAASDSARVEAGANLYLTKSAALFGSFIGEFSNRGSIYSGNGGVRVTW